MANLSALLRGLGAKEKWIAEQYRRASAMGNTSSTRPLGNLRVSLSKLNAPTDDETAMEVDEPETSKSKAKETVKPTAKAEGKKKANVEAEGIISLKKTRG